MLRLPLRHHPGLGVNLTNRFHRDLFLGLSFRGLGAVSSFALTWLLATLFGPEEVGLYYLGLTAALFLGAIVSSGLDLVLIREMGRLLADDRWDDVRATYETCRRYTIQLGIPVVLLLIVGSKPISSWLLGEPRAAQYLVVFACAVLLASLLKLGNAALRSAGRVWQSQLLEGVLYTTLTCIVIGLAFLSGVAITPIFPAFAYVGCLFLVLIASQWRVSGIMALGGKAGKAQIARWDGIRIAGLQTATQLGNLGALALLTIMIGIGDAGIFRIAFQIGIVLQLINTSFGIMAGPHLAASISKKDTSTLLSQITGSGIFGALLCSPLVIAGLLFPELILGIFGQEFSAGSLALQILLIAQLVDVTLGQTGMALVMMRLERKVLFVEIAANITGIGTILLLIPTIGIAAASIGFLVIALIRGLSNATLVMIEIRKIRAHQPIIT